MLVFLRDFLTLSIQVVTTLGIHRQQIDNRYPDAVQHRANGPDSGILFTSVCLLTHYVLVTP